MIRYVDFFEISDGKLYGPNDLVRMDTGGCEGCFACCCGMGSSIVLDPYDVFCLCRGISCQFSDLLADSVELNVQDGLILPNLKMKPETDRCPFLNAEGRCCVHAFRPGLCRLFPLGRYYRENGFSYFLQTKECQKGNRAKMKVRKWLDIPDYPRYAAFIGDWHFLLRKTSDQIAGRQDEVWQKTVCLEILQRFYVSPYEMDEDFYAQFAARSAGFAALLR